jgi:hypothetical protein
MGHSIFFNNRDKDDFVREYHRAQGIFLDGACRAKNSVQNAPATLTLNSTRGRKWAQNEKKTHNTGYYPVRALSYKLNMRNEHPGNILRLTTTGRNTANSQRQPQ